MKYGIKLLVAHVSVERTQAQGIDNISQGVLRSEVAVDKQMIKLCP